MCRLRGASPGTSIMLEDAARRRPRFADNPWTTGELATDPATTASHPLRTPAGVVIGTLCVFDNEAHRVTPEAARGLAQLADRVVDVLELELASRRLSEANARLSTANERLEHFAGQVSHDLKNPLTSVSLSLEALELDVDRPRPARHRWPGPGAGWTGWTDMISDLLAFASQGAASGRRPRRPRRRAGARRSTTWPAGSAPARWPWASCPSCAATPPSCARC